MTASIRELILDEQQPWRDHTTRLGAAREALAAVTAQAQAEHVARTEAEQAHRTAVLTAAQDGTAVPEDLPPPSAGLATALSYAQERVMAIAREAGDAKAEIAEQVEARASEEHDRIVAEAAEHVGALADAAQRMSALLSLVGEVRRAVEAQHPRRSDSPSSRTRPKVTAADLIEDLQRGANVLDPAPMWGPSPEGIVIDRGPEYGEGSRNPGPVRVPDRGRNA